MTGSFAPCPHCGQNMALRKVVMNKVLVSAAIKAYEHSLRIGSNIIKISDLHLTTSEYARFNDLVRFGLLYRPAERKGGEYGVPRERIYRFVDNDWPVMAWYERDPVAKQNYHSPARIYCRDVPSVAKILENFGPKLTEYGELSFHLLMPQFHDQIFSLIEQD